MAGTKSRGAGRRPPRQVWMPRFLAALSETSNVSGAARRARVDTSTVYKARREDAAFNLQWLVALAEGYDNRLPPLNTATHAPLVQADPALHVSASSRQLRSLARAVPDQSHLITSTEIQEP